MFPAGLNAFADYVRSKGMHFGLWFEPERVAFGTRLEQEHRDWVLRVEPTPANCHLLGMAAPQHRDQIATHGLLDFGNPTVCEWVREMFRQMIEAHDIRWIRWDFNMDPRFYWELHDGPERRGISQIRHLQGVYDVLDWLRQRYPLLFIDGCSSGGRRIDLGWLRRAHSYFSSDHTRDTDIVRNHLSGGSRFLPANWLETNVARSAREGTEEIPSYVEPDYADTAFHSKFAGTFGFSDDLAEWTPSRRARAREHIRVYKQLRPYLRGDFHPLFALPASLNAWDGWQFHDPSSEAGFFAVFRMRADDATQSVQLRGLTPNHRYSVVDPYTGSVVQTYAGGQLLEEGLPVELQSNGSVVYSYRIM